MTAMSLTPRPRTVLILGARGRFGRAATDAFRNAGWQVAAFVRPGRAPADSRGITVIEGDAFDPAAVTAAAGGRAVIVHALNPPYPAWPTDLPKQTTSVLAAAKASGATVMIPGNVYNYGHDMPARLTEQTPHRPSVRKGRLREDMENAFRDAAADGVHTVVLRGGDFIEAANTGNWFDGYVAAKVDRGIAVYPGPRDIVHAWAYLPDMARAMVGLAERTQIPGGFESFNFEGFNLTGAELVAAMEQTLGRTLKTRGMPWPIISLMGLVSPLLREVAEMRYLWTVPHALDGAKLRDALPAFTPTPLAEAMRAVLPAAASSHATQPSETKAHA